MGRLISPHKLNMYARIKKGSPVTQDFSWFFWDKPEILFKVDKLKTSNRYKCTSYGFGISFDKSSYGNGAIYCNEENLIFEDNNKITELTKQVEELTKQNESLKDRLRQINNITLGI